MYALESKYMQLRLRKCFANLYHYYGLHGRFQVQVSLEWAMCVP